MVHVAVCNKLLATNRLLTDLYQYHVDNNIFCYGGMIFANHCSPKDVKDHHCYKRGLLTPLLLLCLFSEGKLTQIVTMIRVLFFQNQKCYCISKRLYHSI